MTVEDDRDGPWIEVDIMPTMLTPREAKALRAWLDKAIAWMEAGHE